MRSIRAILILMLAAVAACTPAPAPAPEAATAGVELITLQRTQCFGTCPAYRVSVARGGVVRFQSFNPGDSTAATARIDAAGFEALVREAERIGFHSLPGLIERDPEICGPWATDHPSATVTIHGSAGTKSVSDYHGCHGKSERLAALRRFEDRIDRVAGSARWVRPGRFP